MVEVELQGKKRLSYGSDDVSVTAAVHRDTKHTFYSFHKKRT